MTAALPLSPNRLRLLLGGLMLALLTVFGPPAEAQTEAAPPADAAVEQLLTILRDDTARAALIARLEAETGAAVPTADSTVAEQLAGATSQFVSGIGAEFGALRRELVQMGTLITRVSQSDWLGPEAWALGLTILSTVITYMIFSAAAARIARRLRPSLLAGWGTRLRAVALASAARLAALLLAWAFGYMLATLAFSVDGTPSPAQSLYLNAFAAYGLCRILLRCLANPEADAEPTLSNLAPGAQAIIYGNLRRVSGLVMQGFLFLLPLTQLWIGFAAVRPLRTLLATVAALLALLAIRRIAQALDLARGDKTRGIPGAGETGAAMAQGAQSVWRRVWPPLAIAYVVYAWFIAVTRPSLIDQIVIGGTIYTAVALLVLLLALRLLRAAPGLRAPLPHTVLVAMPRLQTRADVLVSLVAFAAVMALVICAVFLVATGWGWADPVQTLRDQAVQAGLWRIASALIVAVLAASGWAIVASWIDQRLSADLTGPNVSARSRTLLALFRNAFTIAVSIIAVMITLSQLGIDIAPLLAGAGVVGLAIGFGAQKLVQDIITGIFIQLENAINEGDVVGVAGITGGVERVTIRSVRLRTVDGATHIVPFSSVDTVTNLTRDFSVHVADIAVGYRSSIADVKAAMEEAFERLRTEGLGLDLLNGLEIDGIISMAEQAVVVRARIKTRPGKHWAIGRRYTELVKDELDARGIDMPYPQQQMVLSDELRPLFAGNARPAAPAPADA